MFRETFKYYKSRCPPPTYENVIDFEDVNEDAVIPYKINESSDIDKFQPRGLSPKKQWKVFELKDRPGLIFIRNPFTRHGQRYWVARCLQDYPKAPHIVNLDPKYFNKDVIDNWWRYLQAVNGTVDKSEKLRLKNGMRWATLGYHHNWDTKIYDEEQRHKFPEDLAKLSEYFAAVLDLGKYSAEAAIINFYPLGTTLAGHTDHSEKNLDAPLFSISFGQTAIFLLGGKTKDEKPSAMFLKSGDVVCMSRQSRVCFHAVPRIIRTDVSWMDQSLSDHEERTEHYDNDDQKRKVKKRRLTSPSDTEDSFSENVWNDTANEELWRPFADYISDCRINMNVRQVLDFGKTTLNSE